MNRSRRGSGPKAKPRTVLIFGEDSNDSEMVREFVLAIRPEADFQLAVRRKPQIQIKDVTPANLPSRINAIAKVIKADRVDSDVIAVLIHQDADAIEPAHMDISQRLENAFAKEGFAEVRVAVPAWESEAWLMLWPSAFAAYVPTWKPLAVNGRNLGVIADAKEFVSRSLRNGPKGRPYRESDAAPIARIVREQGLLAQKSATSASFAHFEEKVRAL